MTDKEETVLKSEYDKVVAELNRYKAAVEKLVDAMARDYAQNLYREALKD